MLVDDGVLRQHDGALDRGRRPVGDRDPADDPRAADGAAGPAGARAAHGDRAGVGRGTRRSGGAPLPSSRRQRSGRRCRGSLQSLVAQGAHRGPTDPRCGEDAFRFTHILDPGCGVQRRSRRRTGRSCTSGSPTGSSVETQRSRPASTRRSSATTSSRRIARCSSSVRRAIAAAALRRARGRAGWPRPGERAFARGDMPAAVNLLSRAAALLPEHDHPAPGAAARAGVRAHRDRRTSSGWSPSPGRWTRRRPTTGDVEPPGARDRRRALDPRSSRTPRGGPTRPSARRGRAIAIVRQARGRARARRGRGRSSGSCA